MLSKKNVALPAAVFVVSAAVFFCVVLEKQDLSVINFLKENNVIMPSPSQKLLSNLGSVKRLIGDPRNVIVDKATSNFDFINLNPFRPQHPDVYPFKLIQKLPSGKDSYLLRFALPALGNNTDDFAKLESLGSRGVKLFVHGEEEVSGDFEHSNEKNPAKILQKSYSPVQPASAKGFFDLLVKAYPYRAGGGLGQLLGEDINVGDSAYFKIKKERSIFGINQIEDLVKKYKHIGLVAGGTGLAPLIQIAEAKLASENLGSVSLIFVNREEEDILMRKELDELDTKHGKDGRFRVTYALTGKNIAHKSGAGKSYYYGRGNADLAKRALLPTYGGNSSGDDNQTSFEKDILILVCGSDGFVAHWGGSKMKVDGVKVQGPLTGVLKDAGFSEEMVYKY